MYRKRRDLAFIPGGAHRGLVPRRPGTTTRLRSCCQRPDWRLVRRLRSMRFGANHDPIRIVCFGDIRGDAGFYGSTNLAKPMKRITATAWRRARNDDVDCRVVVIGV
jgi:hypothetical protein